MSLHCGGILLFRFKNGELQVLLGHPGGPFWEKKDKKAWSIPKGLIEEDEDPLDAAKREFKEEIGFEVDGKFIDLGKLKQSSKKVIQVWALEKDLDVTKIVSNKFTLEWPKNSGDKKEYPEIEKASWYNIDLAKEMIQNGQLEFIDRLMGFLNYMTKER
jgi:predicted NUDIX family NTP pyrophosphohydrolase